MKVKSESEVTQSCQTHVATPYIKRSLYYISIEEQYEQLSAFDTFKANIYNKGPKTKRKINKQNRVKK